MYFERFPYTYYTLDDRVSAQVIKNIFLRVVFNNRLKETFGAYDQYDIQDGDTPEIVSDKIYGSPLFHWVVLHFNDIIDPRFDWPLSVYNLIEYCNAKYANPSGTHHYVDLNGNIVDSTTPGAVPVSNFDYESGLNDEKRRIKILKPQFLQAVIKEFEDQLRT